MANHPITVYGTTWCGDCYRARRFLQQHSIPYTWIDIDSDRAGEQFVIVTNRGKRRVPTIILADGQILIEPTDQALATSLGISHAR